MLLPTIACVFAISERHANSIKRRLIGALVFGIAFVGVVAPWTIRNYHVHGRFVPIALNGGTTFYGGNNSVVFEEPRRFGTWIPSNHLPSRDIIEAAPDEFTQDQIEWRLGMEWVRNNVSRLPLLALYKFVRFWLPDFDSLNKSYVIIQIVGSTPFLVLIVVGLICSIRRSTLLNWNWLLIHFVMFCSIVTALIFWGSPRFRDANMPILMVYAAVGLSWFQRKWRPRDGAACIKEVQSISKSTTDINCKAID